MKKPDPITIIAILLVTSILAGGILAHMGNPGIYDAEGTITSDGSDFILKSSLTTEYTAVAIDNGSEIPVSKLHIFIDEDYVPCGTSHKSADANVIQFERELNRRGFDNHARVNAEELSDLMEIDDAVGKGILIPFGTLPDIVYSGDSSDSFKKWTAKGGTVYWIGAPPGKYKVSEGESAVTVPSNETVFPFVEGISTRNSIANVPVDPLCSNLSLLSSNTCNSLSPDYPGVVGMGLKDSDGRCTISAVKEGPGTFFVIGGFLGNEGRHDLSALIASGITYESKVVDYKEGSFKGTVDGSLTYEGTNVAVYVIYGGHFPIYGKRIIG